MLSWNGRRAHQCAQPLVPLAVDVNRTVVVVHIRGNGPVIPDEVNERAFGSGTTLRGDGTGFDLSLAETLLAQHGGGLYRTDNEPRGCDGSIVLPRSTQ